MYPPELDEAKCTNVAGQILSVIGTLALALALVLAFDNVGAGIGPPTSAASVEGRFFACFQLLPGHLLLFCVYNT